MPRRTALAARVALLSTALLYAAPALAQPAIPSTAVTIELGNRTESGNDINLISTTDLPKAFNIASCECDTPRTLKVTIYGASSQTGTTNVYMYLGANCADTTSRASYCGLIAVHKLSEFFTQSVLQDVTTSEVVSPVRPTCTPSGARSGANSFWVMIDWNGDQSFDEENDTITSKELNYDVEPPGVVTDVVVEPGEEALNVSWSVPSDTDLVGLQVLCARGSLPVFASGTYTAGYSSAFLMCQGGIDGGVADSGVPEDATTGADAGADDGGVADGGDDAITIQTDAAARHDSAAVSGSTAFTGLAEQDPAYLCSDLLGPTASSRRIATLQNGVVYYVAVVAIDQAGNPSPVTAMVAGAPQEVLDFWEDYKRQGGQATGCDLARPGRGAPARPGSGALAGIVVAVIGLGLALAAGRRRTGGGR